MINAETAINRLRRDLTLSMLLKTVLLSVALLAVLLGPFIGGAFDGSIALLIVGGVWLVLSYRSVRGSRIAADSQSLIAAGRYDIAEEHIVEALHAFSLFRTTKLLSLHHLAVLRHAQRRWQETVKLCRALLRQRLGHAAGLNRATHLILADALLQTGDLHGAHESIMRLYDQRLSLAEALQLLVVQSEYLSRIGAWDTMMIQVQTKAQLAELMPAETAALVQALLALAAKRSGRGDWEQWLRRRSDLLADSSALVHRRPILAELFDRTA